MDWETTPAGAAENRDMELHTNAVLASEGNHAFLVTTQFSRSRLNKQDLNMNIVSPNQSVHGVFSDVPGAGTGDTGMQESLNEHQDEYRELPQYEHPPLGIACRSDLEHPKNLSEPGVKCSSSLSPASIRASSSECSQATDNRVLPSLTEDTNCGDQSQKPALPQMITTGAVIAVNPVDKSILLRHGGKLIKVTNFACLDQNFNLAFISDLAKKTPSAEVYNCGSYNGYSDNQGLVVRTDSSNILAKPGTEVAHVMLPHGYSTSGSGINRLLLNTNDEQQMMLIDVGGKASLLYCDTPTTVPSASVGVSGARTDESARDSMCSLYSPAPLSITVSDISPADQNIVPETATDKSMESVTMEIDIDNSKITHSSKAVILETIKQINSNEANSRICGHVVSNMGEDDTSLSYATTKTVSFPRPVGSQISHTKSNLPLTQTHRISSQSSVCSTQPGTVETTFVPTQNSSLKRVCGNGIVQSYSATVPDIDNHQTSSNDSNVCVKTQSTSQPTVTFCIPATKRFPDKSVSSTSKTNTLKLTNSGRKLPNISAVHAASSSSILLVKSQVSPVVKHPSARSRGNLNIIPNRNSNTSVPSFSARNIRLASPGHNAVTDKTQCNSEDSCDQNSADAINSSQLTSSSSILRSLAWETEASLKTAYIRQPQISGTGSHTPGARPTHRYTDTSNGFTAAKSLHLNNFTTASSTPISLNSTQPVTQESPFNSDFSSTSMDTCEVAMSPASLDTSQESPDTGISSSASLPSSSSFSSEGSSSAANESPPAASFSFTPTTTSNVETHTSVAAADTGRSLRIRHQRRFLPEKPRHKRQTLQDMTRPLKQWLYKHRENPYPTKMEKVELVKHSHMTLTQVSNWFANARRRLKNTVQGDDLSWAKRIKDYNQYAEGNAELFSVPSSDEDEQWDSSDEFNDNREPDSYSHSAISPSTSPSPVPTLTSSLNDPALMSPPITQSLLTSPSISLRYSPNLEEQQGACHKYKHSILQRYLHDASQQVPLADEDDMVTSRARHRNLSSSTGSHDFEYLSTSSLSSPSHEMPHDTFDEFSEEFETIAIRRRVPDPSTNHSTEDLYWKEIGAALALASLARAHSSK